MHCYMFIDMSIYWKIIDMLPIIKIAFYPLPVLDVIERIFPLADCPVCCSCLSTMKIFQFSSAFHAQAHLWKTATEAYVVLHRI